MNNFWRQQKSAIYFGLFLLISVSLIFYSQSKIPEKARNLVQFSLEIIAKIENKNLQILQKINQNSQIPTSAFGNSNSQNSIANNLPNNSQSLFSQNQNVSSQSLGQKSEGLLESTSKSLELTVNFDEKVVDEKTNQNFDKQEITAKSIEDFILEIEENQKSLKNITWKDSNFGTEAEIVNNLARKLVEINQKNWQEVLIELNFWKNNLENEKIWANLEENIKDRNLEKTQKSLEVGGQLLAKKQEIILQKSLSGSQNEQISQNEKWLENISKSQKILEQITNSQETKVISQAQKNSESKKTENLQNSKNKNNNSQSQILDSANSINSTFSLQKINSSDNSNSKNSESKTNTNLAKNPNSDFSKNSQNLNLKKIPTNQTLEKSWQEIEKIWQKNWPKNPILQIEINDIQNKNWQNTKSELGKQSQNLLKKYN